MKPIVLFKIHLIRFLKSSTSSKNPQIKCKMSDWGLSHASLFTLWRKHIPRPPTWNEKRTFASNNLRTCYATDVWRAYIFWLCGCIFLSLRQQGLVLIDEHPIWGGNYTGERTTWTVCCYMNSSEYCDSIRRRFCSLVGRDHETSLFFFRWLLRSVGFRFSASP